jgi:hypothetical protein
VSRRKLNYMVQRMGITHPSWRRNRAGPDGGGGLAGEPADPGDPTDVEDGPSIG